MLYSPDILNTLDTIQDFVRYGASQFYKAQLFFGHGTDNAWDEAYSLVLHVLNFPLNFDIDIRNCRLIELEKKEILDVFQRRIESRLPAPYITKKTLYSGLEFYVDERVLIPRSPIFELIENQFQPWVEPNKVNKILDLCTGSACIAITCQYYFPEADVHASELSEEALQVAQLNIQKHLLENKIHLHRSDLFAAIPKQRFDIIISNPPYVDRFDMESLPAEYQHEPKMALAAGEDGLDCVHQILANAKDYLTPHGILIVEVGNSAPALMDAYPNIDFTWLEFTKGDAEVFLLKYEQLLTEV